MTESTLAIYIQKVKEFFSTDGCSLLYYVSRGWVNFKTFILEANEWVNLNSSSIMRLLYYNVSNSIRDFWNTCEKVIEDMKMVLTDIVDRIDVYFEIRECMLKNICKIEFLSEVGDAIRNKLSNISAAGENSQFLTMYNCLKMGRKIDLNKCTKIFAETGDRVGANYDIQQITRANSIKYGWLYERFKAILNFNRIQKNKSQFQAV